MTAPIGKIGSQRAVSREDGSDGHVQVAKKLDRRIDPKMEQKVRDVAKMYERQFLGEMFKAMRSTVAETDKPSMAQDIYNSQRDEQYVDAWSEQGGVGFSNIIYDQIMERFFGQTSGGQQIRQQGMIKLTDRDISKVSQVKDGHAVEVKPKAVAVAASVAVPVSVEDAEPMPAPTPPKADTRSQAERVAAGELFPQAAVERAPLKTDREVENSQTALQIEVRPSPTGAPARIQAPWDATVVGATKIDGSRSALTLEHGDGLRSTLVFDGIIGARLKAGEKIPKGQVVGILNADAKSFLWNLATRAGGNEPGE